MSGRTLHRKYHFILAKLLRFQRTFPEKPFVSGFGADAPTYNAHEKNAEESAFFIFSLTVGTAFQTSCSYFSYKKSKQKNFPPTTPLYFGKAFEIPKDFSRKVSLIGVWGGQPQHSMHRKRKKHGNAVLFVIFSFCLL